MTGIEMFEKIGCKQIEWTERRIIFSRFNGNVRIIIDPVNKSVKLRGVTATGSMWYPDISLKVMETACQLLHDLEKGD